MANKPNIYKIDSFRGGISDYEDKGIPGSFKFGKNLDIRKDSDSLSAGQALVDIGVSYGSASPSLSPSVSTSPSTSASQSISPSLSPSISASPSRPSHSSSVSPSASTSRSSSLSPSVSTSPSSSISPSVSPSDGLTTQFRDLIRWWVKCTDGNTYGFGNTGIIYKITPEFVCTRVYDVGQPILGAIEKPSSSGNAYILFATATRLHIKLIPGASNWSDVDQVSGWPKTDLTSTDWHTMREVAGDIFIANKSVLAFVGYDDSYSNEVLDLIPGNIAKTIVERNGRAIIGTYRQADPLKGVNGAVDAEYPLAQVGDSGDIYFANMTDTIPAKSIPGGGKVNPGGMTNLVEQVNFFEWESTASAWIDKQSVGNMAMLGIYDNTDGNGGIYTYGRKKKNQPFTLNLEYALDVDEIGAIESVGGIVYASYRDGSTFGVKVTDESNKATGTYDGLDLKVPDKLPETITSWMNVELFMDPLPSGCRVYFYYKLNKTGSYTLARTAEGDTNFSKTNGKKAVFNIGAEAEIFSPRIVMTPYGNNTPNIHRIKIFFM